MRVLYSGGLIYGEKFAFQNRLGLYLEEKLRFKIDWASLHSWKGINVSNLQTVFTETCRDDVDLSKTQPCKYFVYMDRGNPRQE